jgi:hypothetical protein
MNDTPLARALDQARRLAAKGDDEPAKLAYLRALHIDPTHYDALNELGVLAVAGGHRSAARTAWLQAIQHHPDTPAVRVHLANLLLEDGYTADARRHYQAALDADPGLPEAHQGLARILSESGNTGAELHWQKGFAGHSVVARRYRGTGPGHSVLLLVSARGGNLPTRLWINDRRFAVTAIYADFHDPAQPLPPHALAVNAIGDADLCDAALVCAETMLRRTAAPMINQPACVRRTGRVDNARRLGQVPGVIAPRITRVHRSAIPTLDGLEFPLLLRAPGFHTGQHFHFVADRAALSSAAAALAGEEVLVIQYLDARGPDGMARKYRVMFIDGALYPLHMAVSADWKVHYFTAGMATHAVHREEERRFLQDMPAVLGKTAMAALTGIASTLGLDYAGADFALAPDGSVMLFEANATMVVAPPAADPVWDYRRPAIAAVLKAVERMLARRLPV